MSILSDFFSNDKTKFKRDMSVLTSFLQSTKKDWLHMDEAELETLAMKIRPGKKHRSGFTSYPAGELYSIFHELLGSYAYRTYGDRRGILAVQTNPYLYSFFVKPKYTEVFINHRRLAYLLADGVIKNSSGRKVIGEIKWTSPDAPQVLIGDNNFGVLNKPSRRMNERLRAIQMMHTMPAGVQELFTATVLLYVIEGQTDLDAITPV